jgi:hypothetical protein
MEKIFKNWKKMWEDFIVYSKHVGKMTKFNKCKCFKKVRTHAPLQCVHSNCTRFEECQLRGMRGVDNTKYWKVPYMKVPGTHHSISRNAHCATRPKTFHALHLHQQIWIIKIYVPHYGHCSLASISEIINFPVP